MAPVQCLYEVLNVERDCTAAELKKSYYKLALKYHPDKCGGNEDAEVVSRFQEIQNAYEVLSDPQERQWYDDHREQILSGDDEMDASEFTVNVFKYFRTSCYEGYSSSNPKNFYRVYQQVFDEILEKEGFSAAEVQKAVSLGDSKTDIDTVLHFYAYWCGFVSNRSFGWCDQYKPSEGPSRYVRRMMEKENKKLREVEKRKYVNQVRMLADFVKKRDRRVLQHKVEVERAQKIRKEEAQEKKRMQEEKYREEREAFKQQQLEQWMEEEKQRLAQAPTDRTVRIAEAAEEEELEKIRKKLDTEKLYCQPCKKSFKSNKQLENHMKSKKHKECVAKVAKLNSKKPTKNAPREVEVNINDVIDGIDLDKTSINEEKEALQTTEETLRTELADIDVTEAVEDAEEKQEAQEQYQKEVVDLEAKKKAARKAKAELDAARRLKRKEKRKQKKAEGQKQAGQAHHSCNVCDSVFDTKNALFKHLKVEGHAAAQ